MGLFSRKQGKAPAANQPPEKASIHSNGSLKSSATQKMDRLSKPTIPDIPIPKAPDPQTNPAAYLRSIYAVRDRSKVVLEKAKKNQLKHFNVDMNKFPDVVSYVVSIIKVRTLLRSSKAIAPLRVRFQPMRDVPR